MPTKTKVAIFTYLPSPYQVELFDAITAQKSIELRVIYVQAQATTMPTARLWQIPDLKHNYLFLEHVAGGTTELKTIVDASDCVIFNYYQHPLLFELIQYCQRQRKSWCFWGERPGYRQLGQLGTYYRRWKLWDLYQSQAPIWGVGEWAVRQYQREFGKKRRYCNLPYFSNLERFAGHRERVSPAKNFLFSGSLIERKGVDLLAAAFVKLAAEFPAVTLTLVGEGDSRSLLEQQLAEYRDRVQFLGFQPWEALPQYYQAADILCVPSRYDGWALVVPEGLAAGLPVIGTERTGAALDLIKPGQNGWLIPTDSASALYNAMRQAVLLSAEEYLRWSDAARLSVAQHSLTDGVDRFHQAIEATLGA
jgi:glycosyltransferase involved in cell wall biosynthesis